MDDAPHPARPRQDPGPSRRALLGLGLVLGTGLTPRPGHAVEHAVVTADDQPTSGGTLRLGLGGGSTTDSLDPRAWDDSVMIATAFALYNGLVENSADNRPVPELATSWEPRDGARTWRFALRTGVHFHDGKVFDADDVVYSLNLHRGDTASGAAGVMQPVTDVRKIDASTIEVRLASGNADFPTVLTDYHLVMVPNGFSDWARPIGTGAFALDSFEPGVRILFKKAGPYWKPERGYLDAVELLVINDTGARMNALILGQVDAINRADPRTVSRVERSPTLGIVRAAGGWYPVMAMMVDRAPYAASTFARP